MIGEELKTKWVKIQKTTCFSLDHIIKLDKCFYKSGIEKLKSAKSKIDDYSQELTKSHHVSKGINSDLVNQEMIKHMSIQYLVWDLKKH